MKKEIVINARSVEEAVAQGAAMLGMDAENMEYEVIEEPKKGFLGVGGAPAKIKILVRQTPAEAAMAFVQTLVDDLELDANVELKRNDEGDELVNVWGGNAGALIGHHGDTLDALQYLANLAAVRVGDGYAKIAVDVEHYRSKREQTLRQLARRTAQKALKYRRSVTLEPMNPYERRIIHSEIQSIEGVTTTSIGSDNARRVVVYLTDLPLPDILKENEDTAGKNGSKKRRRRSRGNGESKAPAKTVLAPDPEGEEYYIDAPTTYVHAPTPRPEKLKSIASYFGDEEEDASDEGYFSEEEDQPSELAKLCGIYDDSDDPRADAEEDEAE